MANVPPLGAQTELTLTVQEGALTGRVTGTVVRTPLRHGGWGPALVPPPGCGSAVICLPENMADWGTERFVWKDPYYNWYEENDPENGMAVSTFGPLDLLGGIVALLRLALGAVVTAMGAAESTQAAAAGAAIATRYALPRGLGVLQRGVAPAEAKAAMGQLGHAGRSANGGMMYTSEALKHPPAFLVGGRSGMTAGTDELTGAILDMRFYAKEGTQLQFYSTKMGRQFAGDAAYQARSMADIYFPSARGRLLTYRGDDFIDGMKYTGNLTGKIRYLKETAKPMGMSPAPVGVDAAGNAVFRLKDFTRLGPGHPAFSR